MSLSQEMEICLQMLGWMMIIVFVFGTGGNKRNLLQQGRDLFFNLLGKKCISKSYHMPGCPRRNATDLIGDSSKNLGPIN